MLSKESILEPLMFEFFGIKNFSNPIRFNSFIIFSIPLIVLSSPPNPTSPIDAMRLGIGLSKKLEKIEIANGKSYPLPFNLIPPTTFIYMS